MMAPPTPPTTAPGGPATAAPTPAPMAAPVTVRELMACAWEDTADRATAVKIEMIVARIEISSDCAVREINALVPLFCSPRSIEAGPPWPDAPGSSPAPGPPHLGLDRLGPAGGPA